MERYALSAHYVKTSLNLTKIEQKNADLPLFSLIRRERNLLLYQATENRFVCAYSFGVIVFFGIDDRKEIGKLLKRFGQGDDDPNVRIDKVPPEDYAVVVDPDQPEAVEFDFVRLRQVTVEKVALISYVIAQSVAIDFLESQMQETLARFETIHRGMAKNGKLNTDARTVVKTLGAGGNTVHFIINRLSLLDKPDITWEDKEAEAIFTGLRKMFELDDRFGTLSFKLEFAQSSSETMLEALHTRRAEVLEWIVILLFVLDIAFALLGMFK